MKTKLVNLSCETLEEFRILYAIRKREISLNKKYEKIYTEEE
jgi:hypothetical protein